MTNQPFCPCDRSKEIIYDAPEDAVMNGITNHCGCECEKKINDLSKCIHNSECIHIFTKKYTIDPNNLCLVDHIHYHV